MNRFPPQLKHDTGEMMDLDATRLLLGLLNPIEIDKVRRLLKGTGLILEDAGDEDQGALDLLGQLVNHTDQRYWTRTQTGQPIDDKILGEVNRRFDALLDWIGPVYRIGDGQGGGGLLCPLPHVLVVRPPAPLSDSQEKEFTALLRRHGLREERKKSQYLGALRYLTIKAPAEHTAYELKDVLREEAGQLIAEVLFENMPLVVPLAAVPNDPLFGQQWNMTRIQAGGPGTTGWDLSTGAAGTVVAVLDTGCDLTHPDITYAGQGVNLGTMGGTGAPVGTANTIGHGTSCAGIVAANFNNAVGVAGVGGGCRIMPIAFQNWTDLECAAGINFAAANGANVLSMSFRVYAPGDGFLPAPGWNFATINAAITNAVNTQGMVLCAATGNENQGVINGYPARHQLVMACGASDQADNRKSNVSPDGECWGSVFGPGVSVVAPGVLIPTTDIQGAPGYNSNGGPRPGPCVNYPVAGDAAGNFFFQFNGTSAATPHVAGLAAVIRSLYPALTNVQIQTLIERTANKVGATAYADAPGFPNGTRNQQMGYGRINMLRALDFADVMIKDWSGDAGAEPSSPPGGNFWSFSDIVLRPADDNVFVPSDPQKSGLVERGQTNYLYIDVTNNGPRQARNVVVTARITTWVGVQFVYPADWTNIDATHISPTAVTNTFANIPSGGTARAKFTISAAQVQTLWSQNWHPCLLASVNADNDYAFATAAFGPGTHLAQRRNNLAQRNLSVVNNIPGAAAAFPFLAGNVFSADRFMEIVIDRSRLPLDMLLLLALDADGREFPLVDLAPGETDTEGPCCGGISFLDRTRIAVKSHCCEGVLTLEKGSRFHCPPTAKKRPVDVEGGEVILRGGKRFVEVREQLAIIRMEKEAHRFVPLALQTTIPADAEQGEQFLITVSQRNAQQQTVGGASVLHIVS